jgi:peptide/nickel transport system substrate-binding protein
MSISDDENFLDNKSNSSEYLWSKLNLWRRSNYISRIEEMLPSFSPAERATLYGLSILLAISVVFLLIDLNKEATVEMPGDGGSIVEGLVGTPRFINPLLALSDTDRDLTALVYSGLMRATPDGEIVPDLAESFTISEDGLIYSFKIRDDATFHDGTAVSSGDIAFTVGLAQTPDIKSPKRADWEGVGIEEIDEKTINFILGRPYAPFLENTTIGILPTHLWKNVPPGEFPFFRLNTRPIGSGPYKFDSMQSDNTGAPTKYALKSFKKFALGKPHINSIKFFFYTNEDALIRAFENSSIKSASGISPIHLSEIDTKKSTVLKTTLPRVFAIFLNQNKADVLSETKVREALNLSLDKRAIINDVLGGFGNALNGPIPPGVLVSIGKIGNVENNISLTQNERLELAGAILEKSGWERSEETGIWENDGTPLAFSLKTANTPELALTAEKVVETWNALGADVSLEIFATNDLNTAVIRPREYQALLFGEIVGRTLDLFAFWHSSQRADPGLNLALYTNSDADKLLSEARVETDRESREEKYEEFGELVINDIPAIFLYAPEFIYIVPDELIGIKLGALTTPAERFLNIYQWHTETERIWSIFE